jgi:large subunit ribosomal protein L35
MKMKTKKIVRRRFKITKTGKILHRAQGARHLRSKKSKSRQRRQDAPKIVINRRSQQIINRFLKT